MTTSDATSDYEFTSPQNDTLTTLQRAMKVTGLAQLVAAVLGCVGVGRLTGVLPGVVGLALLALLALPVVIGAWTFRAAYHFQRIVDSEGDDVGHLMKALGELKKLYLLQAVLFVVSLVLALVMDVGPGAG